eukprot:scaffold2383_cov17-Tisochrysis_lutea.AAC.1
MPFIALQVALSPSDWYNMSKASGQVNQQGVPFGFFPRLFPGKSRWKFVLKSNTLLLNNLKAV